ncbi:MAG: hypothetical protein JW719_09855, partial [Pirellulales bacterium]|nr:hypothetical protein [Pirellulales bacterium]
MTHGSRREQYHRVEGRIRRLSRLRELRLESLEDRRLLSVACPSEMGALELSRDVKAWTFMVYLDGDNNLEGAGIDDFLEMASVGSDSNINIVVQFDRVSDYDTSYDDWTDTRRGIIMPGDLPDASWGTSLGEVNMGNPANLSEFVNWATLNYPADNYALVLWDHGSGWRAPADNKGACWDDTDGGDYLENREVGAALAAVPANLDLFGYDCCLMAMLECAHQVHNEASVFVTSEETEPGDGWPYDVVLAHLKTNPTWTAAQLGADIVVEYGISYGGGYGTTQSATDLSVVGAASPSGLSATISELAATIISDATAVDYDLLQIHRENAPYFSNSSYRDLGVFLAGVAGDADLTSSIRDKAGAALTAYDAAIIQNFTDPALGGTGLAIYFQSPGAAPDSQYNSSILSFAGDTQWDEFLNWWAGPVWPGPDLTGAALNVAPSHLYGVATASVTFTVANRGTLAADAGPFDVEFFFSDDADFDNGDEIPANLDVSDPHFDPSNPNAYHFTALPANTSGSDTITLAVPSSDPFGTDGCYYLGMRVDESNMVLEYHELNNHSEGLGLDLDAVDWLDEFYSINMDVAPGWTYEGEWAWGAPLGQEGDPSSGHTGSNVVGYNLSGTYVDNIASTYYVTTAAIDCSGYENVALDFWRWLGVESSYFDHATVEVSNDGATWTTVWSNPLEAVYETAWSSQQYDISAVADDQSTVYIRWGLGPTDSSVTYCGWNIDDVALFGTLTGPDMRGPRVVSQEPSGSVGAGQSTMTFHFNETMDTTSFTVADDVVSFTGPGGVDLMPQITGFTWANGQTLTVQFNARTDVGDYTMVIGPNITDDDPTFNPMNQDGDAINGEMPADCYSASFTIFDAIFAADMQSNPGWTLEGQWQYGMPAGNDGDPSSGHSGTAVIGYNLAGMYPDSMPATEYATTPVFSTVGYTDVRLGFWRWLGIESASFDHANIQVWDGSAWTTIWYHDSGTFTDNGWIYQEYALPASASNQPQVRIRWGMGPTDGSVTYCGWNIDDVLVTGTSIGPDTVGPSVIGQTPSGIVGPGQTSLQFTFNEPMDTGSFTIADDVLTFTGPGEVELKSQITGFEWISDQTLVVQFNAQAAVGYYTMAIGPNITDDGPSFNPMNQDGDGVNGELFTDCYFGSFIQEVGRIEGDKWSDMDGDGVRDDGEPTLAGWTIYLDANNNGAWDDGEPTQVTDASGHYVFDDLAPGTYMVREVAQPGWTQTSPAAGGALDNFDDGNIAEYVEYGDASGSSVTGAAAHDGPFGLAQTNGVGWLVRDDAQAHVAQGQTFSVWVNLGTELSGRVYFAFGATDSGALSAVLAPNTAEFIIQNNAGYGYSNLASASQVYSIDHWYRVEVDWGAGGTILASLFDSDGATLLNTVTATSTTITSGGIGFRAFGGTTSWDTASSGASGIPDAHRVILAAGQIVTGKDFGNHQEAAVDYGDAPDPSYPTLLASNGARHAALGPMLGASRDTEPDGQPSPAANGDDTAGTPDDEDGVVPVGSTLWASTRTANPTATVRIDLQNADPSSNRLDAWIDFNRDGDWNDPGEMIFDNFDLGISDGVQTLTFTIPRDLGDNVDLGDTYARFRLSTAGGLAPTGAAGDGEVEDYLVSLSSFEPIPGDADLNNIVNEADARILADHWGMASGVSWTEGDFNDDGKVDAADAAVLAANWGAMPFEPIPGDADLNNIVNEADARILADHWGMTSGVSWTEGDFNDDGKVDAADAAILAANWGAMAIEPIPGDADLNNIVNEADARILADH